MKFQFDKKMEFWDFWIFYLKLKIRLASGQKRLKMKIVEDFRNPWNLAQLERDVI